MHWSYARVVMPILLSLVILAFFGLTHEGLTGWERPAAVVLVLVGLGVILPIRKGK
ncbi:hypothetical protein [Deinococcus terrestris]|uniref:hypothetical protein n=1 Tax=Deinococcus terrestris TaxID=2651870 RepID=UPI0018831CA4|nr:hypothetical protein [Deinococcus terrestris]